MRWSRAELEELRAIIAKPRLERYGALKAFAVAHGRGHAAVRARASQLRDPPAETFAERMTRILAESRPMVRDAALRVAPHHEDECEAMG